MTFVVLFKIQPCSSDVLRFSLIHFWCSNHHCSRSSMWCC